MNDHLQIEPEDLEAFYDVYNAVEDLGDRLKEISPDIRRGLGSLQRSIKKSCYDFEPCDFVNPKELEEAAKWFEGNPGKAPPARNYFPDDMGQI